MTATSRAAEEKIGVLLQEDRDTMGHPKSIIRWRVCRDRVL